MRSLLPKSLFGRTLLVLVSGLLASTLVGAWIYSYDRAQALRDVGGAAVAERIANLVRLVEEAPRDWQDRIVSASSDTAFIVGLAGEPLDQAGASLGDQSLTETFKSMLLDRLSPPANNAPIVTVTSLSCADCTPGSADASCAGCASALFNACEGCNPATTASDHHESESEGEHETGPEATHEQSDWFASVAVSWPLNDGRWLNLTTGLPGGGPAFSNRFLMSMSAVAVIVLAMTIWVVRRVTSPLAALARAAHRLGQDLNSPPMAETGTAETRQAAQAFNLMQSRLRAVVDNRTQTLSAISHDFRTPLTLLRLRIENVENPSERSKMLAAISDLDTMVASALEFVQAESGAAQFRTTDLSALLQSIVDDFADAGRPVKLISSAEIRYGCDQLKLKRAITNLIDNAVKYGGSASVKSLLHKEGIEILIEDEGPGISDDKLSHVMEPLYRLENSRSRETGGMGLGLAIAASIIRSHGGSLTLTNRHEGGLTARIFLPVAQAILQAGSRSGRLGSVVAGNDRVRKHQNGSS